MSDEKMEIEYNGNAKHCGSNIFKQIRNQI